MITMNEPINEDDERILRKALSLAKGESALREEEVSLPEPGKNQGGDVLKEDDDEAYSQALTGSPAVQTESEEETAKKALHYTVWNTVIKYLQKDPALAQAITSDFDEAMKQVFQPHGGTDRFVNLRTPGQPPAKLQASPGTSGSNETGRVPRTATGYRGSGTPSATYDSGYSQAYRNPTSPGSGYPSEEPERYGRQTIGAGDSDKPDRQPRLRNTNPYNSQRGAAVPGHPSTEQTVPIGTYEKPTYLTTDTRKSLMKSMLHESGYGDQVPETSGNLPDNPDQSTRGIIPQENVAVKAVFKSKGEIAEKLSHTGTEKQVGYPSIDQQYAEDEEATHVIRRHINKSLSKRMDGTDN